MTSTFHSIETAKRSLFTQTAALNTTGHNISNANTEGYSRQTVKMKPSLSIEAYGLNRSNTPGQLGTGVEYDSITRIRESFLDSQYRNENQSLGNWTTQADTLNKLQSIFNEPSETGINTVVNNFWNAWSSLSKNPEDVTARKIVKENTLALTDAINQTSKQLSDLDSDLTSSISIKASEIQNYLSSISDLNKSITRIEGLGDDANDLRDQRDLLTDKLSNIVNINVTENDQGYSISMGGQQLLANGTEVTPITSSLLSDAYSGNNLHGGEVYGMFVSKEKFVADYTNQLNQLVNTIANGDVNVTLPAGSTLSQDAVAAKDTIVVLNGVDTKIAAGDTIGKGAILKSATDITAKGINGLHQLGYTLDGSSGEPLFTSSDGSSTLTAANITLNPDIAINPDLIASSMRLDDNGNPIKGNNSLALIVSELKNNKFTVSGTTNQATVSGFFTSIVGQLGVQAQDATRKVENATTLTTQVETSRQSVSGVSLDEEMSNLIKFQHAYSAASRFMTTFDQLLDKLINSTGTVGR